MKTIKLRLVLLIFGLTVISCNVFAQGVAINTSGNPADASAMLDVQSNDKGLLIPRVALSQTTSASPVSNPIASLMVFNTATANDVTPGYYYWTGSNWVKMFAGNPNDYILNQYAVDQAGGYRIGGNALIGGYLSIGTTGQHGKLHSYVGNTAVTTHSYNSYFENFATNTTTDAISKFGVCSEVTGTFTGSTGSNTFSYGVYATATGADYNTGVYGNGTTVGIKGITSGDGAFAGHFMNLSNADTYNYGLYTTSTGNTTSGRKYGIYTYAGGGGVANYGIYASALGAANNWAGYFDGKIETTGQIISTVPLGTPPFYVQSSTLNVNLNADLLDGYHYNNLPYLTNTNISGTTNYVSKFNGTNSIGNSQIFDNGTNVGIGTATPGTRLDVTGGSIRTANQLISTQATGTAPLAVSSTTVVANFNADLHDGYHAGNASGNIPISNGTLNTNLNADLLDGNHATAFSTSGHTHAILSQGTGIATFSYNGSTATTVGLTGQALAFHNLGTFGLVALTSSGNVTSRTLTGTANQLTITNGNGVSGNPNVGLNASVPEQIRANVNITGGGNISYDASGNFRWDNRFIIISNGRGTHFSTVGYYDITIPAIGATITGAGGAASVDVNASGIPIGVWQALYYIVVPGNSNTSVAANFRIVSYTADLEVPESWILLAVRNGDNNILRVGTGIQLSLGQTWGAGTSPVSGGGTINYVSKWTNTTGLGNSQIFDNGTSVGIGTATPGWKLDVVGNARIGANTGQNNLAALAVSAGQGSASTFRDIDLHGSWSAGEGHSITASHSTGSANIVGQIVFQHDSPGSRIRFGRLYDSGDQATYPMELVSNGSNGILRLNTDSYTLYGANSTWGAYLQVGGNGRVTTYASVAATNGNLHLDAADGSFATYVNFYSQNNTYINAQAGNVGIGTTGPSYKLDVAGDIRSTGNHILNNTSPTIYLQDSDNRSGMIHMNSNLLYFLSGNGTNSMTWAINGSYWPMTINMTNDEITVGGATYFMEGNVGIGTISPSYKLHVVGTTYDYLDGNHYSYMGYNTNWTNYSYQNNPSTAAAGNYWAEYGYHTCAYNGTDYSSGMQGGLKGYCYWGMLYTAGVQGWNFGDYNRSSGVHGYNSYNGAWGALGYKNSGGTSYGGYFTSYTSGTGYLSNTEIISAGMGSYGGTIGSWSRGEIMGMATSGELFALYNDGNAYTEGYSADIVETDDGRKAAYSVTATEIKIYADGKANISGNEVFVKFDNEFAAMISTEELPNVTISPIGGWAPVYIKTITNEGFIVAIDNNNGTSLNFTWIAVAKRLDSDNASLPADLAGDRFNENIRGFMFNENDTQNSATPMWWDGSQIRFDKLPEKPIDMGKKMEEEAKMKEGIK